jgi:primase-polymerase (primpol)-like protein
MTVTGDVFRPAPIVEANATLQSLWLEMSKETASISEYYAGTLEESETDTEIIQRAINAANGEKFKSLYSGKWQTYYPSQSEADFALVDMLAFYTKNKEQIKRIFRCSALGERNKQTSIKGVPYLDHITNRAFDRTPPPINFDSIVNNIAETVAESKKKKQTKTDDAPVTTSKAYSVPPGLLGEIAQFVYARAATSTSPTRGRVKTPH